MPRAECNSTAACPSLVRYRAAGAMQGIVRREMSRARIHQYVPIFYLKGWRSARDSKLARYSRIRGEIRVDRCSARATGFEPDLYQLTHVAEGERDAIERWLAQEVDTPASEALRVQLRGGQLMPDQHVAWVRFVMSMRARSPDAITMIRQTGSGYASDFPFGTRLGRCAVTPFRPPASTPR